VPSPQPHYEPELMERFAVMLERRARSVVRGVALAGALLGAAVGAVPLTRAGDAWPVPHTLATVALGAALGGLVGFAAARRRASTLRLHAQSTLCQLHAQRTTLALWLLLKERPLETGPLPEPVLEAAVPLEPEVVPAPEPEPEPEPEPLVPLAFPAPPAEIAFAPVPVLAAAPAPPPLPPPAAAPAPPPLSPHPLGG
jgi:hypothetical protein